MANPVHRYQAGGQQARSLVPGCGHRLEPGARRGGRRLPRCRAVAIGRRRSGPVERAQPEAWPAADYDPKQLSVLTAQKSVNQYGDGDVLRIVQTPHDGSRKVWRDADGRYAEQYGQLPSYYVIEASGGRPKGKRQSPVPHFRRWPRSALHARDPGHSAQPRRARHLLHHRRQCRPEHRLVKREYAEGHDIGNHTYTHPNIALVSEERAALELSTTQRIIENALGVSTVLFRPPYNADSQPQTPEEILPVLRAQKAGYVTVGERIDPRDWVKGFGG
jgi:hypothetical protein